MIYAINYADSNFERNRGYNTKTAYSKGKVDKVIEYSPENIDEDFKKKYANIFSYKRGNGLWLWKPYFILKTLYKIKDGDYLFYCDSGAIFVNKVKYLVDVLKNNNQSVMLFETSLLSRQFTKKESFYLMDFNEFNHNQILSGYILIKKNANSVQFVHEWLDFMCDERILSYKHFLKEIEEFKDFVSHREDQSVLDILARKKRIPVYRDPSDYGDRPWQYASKHWTFAEKTYNNSPYPKILISNRKSNPIIYKYKEKIKTILNHLNIYTKKYYFKKYNINPLKNEQ